MKSAGQVGGRDHKISDVSEKSGGNVTSEDAKSAQGANRSPVKVQTSTNVNALKASFSASANKVLSADEREQKVLDLLDSL